ncbi:HDOD domain-containing protein [Pelagicoccus sp. SDUM812005]|uniref:HDOD domain-containing protein n=1 Tax=Pelagicoccus sp. SDUM812005 TaxID=3041257 RepID=UPI00280E57F4|nr:HDOD domain-containing protein [Pelagicoccus sp. SDUM812005]MDQ8180065.1 HDOD domain-containing protein [Pelagicoccus sp. SDUM812005]
MNTISPAELKEAAKLLPSSPRIFGKLSKLLRDPSTDLSDITDLVNADSALTASVLRLSNSAMYSLGTSVDTLDEAINRVGFRELFKLVGFAASKQLFAEHNRVYNISGSQLWENSLACGISMEVLARKIGYDDQEAYTIGLLRNMGKMVLDYCVKNDPQYPSYNTQSNLPLIDWEQNNFGITNPTVAGFILVSWNFPEETSLTIQHQYQPEEAPRSLPLIHLLNLSNGIAEKIGKGLHGESNYWTDWKAHLPRTGLSFDEFKESVTEIRTSLARVVANF